MINLMKHMQVHAARAVRNREDPSLAIIESSITSSCVEKLASHVWGADARRVYSRTFKSDASFAKTLYNSEIGRQGNFT